MARKEGRRFLTSRHIRERLAHEMLGNAGIKVEEAGGKLFKPIEEVVIEVDRGYPAAGIEELGNRRANMTGMQISSVGTIRMEFLIFSWALMGFRSLGTSLS